MTSLSDPPKVTKQQRTQLTVADKVEIARQLTSGSTVPCVMQQFKIARRTAHYIKKNAKTLLEMTPEKSLNLKRMRPAKYPDIEINLLRFIRMARSAKLPVTPRVLQAKALQIKANLLATTDSQTVRENLYGFRGSLGWVESFIKRNLVETDPINGHTTPNENVAETAPHIEDFRQALSEYDLDCIFNVEETGLFFRLLPRKTYMSQAEDRKSVRTIKNMKAKDRLTTILCVNATGSCKLPVAVIGTVKNPRCFQNQEPPLPYFAQPNAFSDPVTFKKWYLAVFLPFIRHTTSKKVALIMNNFSAPVEDLVDVRGQVSILWLPSNCGAAHQPINNGVITSFKARYRYDLLNEFINTFEDRQQRRNNAQEMRAGTRGLAQGYDPHVFDTIKMILKAWDAVPQASIARCWLRAEVLPAPKAKDLTANFGNPTAIHTVVEHDEIGQIFRLVTEAEARSEGCTGVPGAIERRDIEKWVDIESDEAVRQGIVDDLVDDLQNVEPECLEAMEEGKDGEQTSAVAQVPSLAEIGELFRPLETIGVKSGFEKALLALRAAKRVFMDAHRNVKNKKQKTTP